MIRSEPDHPNLAIGLFSLFPVFLAFPGYRSGVFLGFPVYCSGVFLWGLSLQPQVRVEVVVAFKRIALDSREFLPLPHRPEAGIEKKGQIRRG